LAEGLRGLSVPVVLQVGSESPREPFATDRLAAVLPDVRIEVLEGQAHEGMTTAPEQFAKAVRRIFSE
jgi:pimeloyl-ACP methyl ester carboxylesterase